MAVVNMLLPEIVATACVLLMFALTLFDKLTAERVRFAAISGSLILITACLYSLDQTGLLFSDGYKIDSYGQFFKLLVAIGLFANALLGWPLRSIPESQRTEYYLFFFSAGLGMILLASVFNFLLLYLAMELVSYSLYIMVGMRRDRTEAVESTVKYFLIGAASSAVGLYGLSLIYGALSSLGFSQLLTSLQSGLAPQDMLIAGIVLVFSSFLFKLAAFPFHAWGPDAYDGAASPVAMFLSSVSKLAGIAALFRLVYLCEPYLANMQLALGTIAVLTMSYGNFVAFRQTSVKRLFAYSSIAQAGYIILGMIGHSQSAPQAVVFYSVSYLLMNLVLFMVTLELEQKVPDPAIDSFRGLYRRSALLALALMIALFSLAGVPPLAGFFGKWLLFSSAAESGHVWLVAIAILNSVISLYYYLFLVKSAYFGGADDKYPVLTVPTLPRAAAYVLAGVIALLGIYPLPLVDFLAQLNLGTGMLP